VITRSSARPRACPAVALGLAAGLMTLAAGQPVSGQSAAGRDGIDATEVALTVHLDSFAIVGSGPIVEAQAVSLVEDHLSGAGAAQRLGPNGWTLSVDSATRDELRAAVVALRGLAEVRWAGFMVRAAGAGEAAIVTDEFLTLFAPGATRAEIDSINAQNAVVVLHEPGRVPGLYLLGVTGESELDALAMANRYHLFSEVSYAHPNFLLQDEGESVAGPSRPGATRAFPDDTLYPQEWHLYNQAAVVAPGESRPDIHAPEAWTLTHGSPDITIAIIELQGFQSDHPDLVHKLWDNPWEPANTANDPWAKPADEHGWNFGGCPTPNWTDPATDPCGSPGFAGKPNAHGTAVAGVAGAQTDNLIGVASVCPACRLMLISYQTSVAFGLSKTRAGAFRYAADMGADVINASFSSPYNDNTFIAAVQYAATHGRGGKGILIAAAAPSMLGDFCGSPPIFAASPFVMSVAATDQQDARIGTQNGPCLTMSAPGIDIYTTGPMSSYAADTGTSFAAPQVAGVAGLLLSRKGELTRDEVKACLEAGADEVGSIVYVNGRNDWYGSGRLNAFETLNRTECGGGVTDNGYTGGSDPDSADRFEVGVRAGLVVRDAATTDSKFGLPGGGPLGAAVIYGSWFPNSLLIADLQIGVSRLWSSPDELTISVGALVGMRWGPVYLGPSLAARNEDLGAGASTEWGYGVGVGYRIPLGSKVAWRLESLYRWWNGISTHEFGLAMGLGVRLP
jgi:thermitase